MDYPSTGTYTRRRFNYDELLHMPWGSSATFTLRDKKGQVLTKVHGKTRGLGPDYLKHPPPGFPPGYPSYSVITANGITDIIEHRKPEPIFYITDDPAVCKELGVGQKGDRKQ